MKTKKEKKERKKKEQVTDETKSSQCIYVLLITEVNI